MISGDCELAFSSTVIPPPVRVPLYYEYIMKFVARARSRTRALYRSLALCTPRSRAKATQHPHSLSTVAARYKHRSRELRTPPRLEDHIGVLAGEQGGGLRGLLLRDLLLGEQRLLLVLRALQAEELLALELVQFGVDVRHRCGEARHDNAVEGVHAAVGHLDRLVQRGEGGLQRGELHQDLDGDRERLACLDDLLPALSHTDQRGARVVGARLSCEHRHLHARHVVDSEAHLRSGRGRVLDHGRLDVACCVLDLREGEHAVLERRAHRFLAVHNLLEQAAHAHCERVGLLLEQAVPLLGAHELDLHHAQVLARGEHV
mmetsp:Transcript_24475/g.61938  ORF Transcript_24475/g.61938 Transcript_24475/m.61938 type:complete len:318 (-) Transcript_24475:90-1043(-)